MKCGKCGANNLDYQAFCQSCGTPLGGDTSKNYMQQPYQPQPYYKPPRRPENTALLSLVAAILSVTLYCGFSLIGLAMGILSIIFGYKVKNDCSVSVGMSKDMANIAFILGIIGCSVQFICIIIQLVYLASIMEFLDYLM